MKKIFAILMFFSLFSICHISAQTKDNGGSLILFSISYENYAWDYVYEGTTIDSEGKVHSFDYPESELGPLSKSGVPRKNKDLKAKFNHGKKYIKTISLEELQKMVALIPEVAAASMSKKLDSGRDMGRYLWVAYEHNLESNTFKSIIIKEDGDSSCQKLTPATKKLLTLLDAVKKTK